MPSIGATHLRWRGLWGRGVGYGAGLAAVAGVTLIMAFVLGRVDLANSSMLYLLAVMGTAVAFGRGPAIFASFVAFLVFDWFFVPPIHELNVSSPDQWLSLVFFLLTAIVTGQLAAAQRQRAQEARQREREALVLYDVVRLVGEQDLEEALGAVAERLREELALAAAAVDIVQESGGTLRIAAGEEPALRMLEAGSIGPAHLLNTGRSASDGRSRAPARWIRVVPVARVGGDEVVHWGDRLHLVPVRAHERRLGALLLVSSPGSAPFNAISDRLLEAAAGQLGLAVERNRLRRQANDAEILRRTDDLRRALLNAVSHDLRTPLASIMASAGSLRQEDVAWTEDERRDFVQAIEDEAKRLNRIVGHLLDLSRIEGGSLQPEKGWYDVGALVDDVLGRLRPVTAQHRIVVQVPDDVSPVPLDYVEIDQVLSNLVENATKYAPADSDITITVQQPAGELRVSVSDRGKGIPASALPHLFDPFYRVADGAPTPAGLGLGLAVAKGLVEAHGGRIWAENLPGGGARFTFTLPSEADAAAPAPVGVASP